MNNSSIKIGKIVFAVTMIVFGFNHFMKAEQMAQMTLSYMPATLGTILTYLTGATLIAAAIGIITGIKGQLAALLLSIQLFSIILAVWIPAVVAGAPADMTIPMILKDLGLAAGALIISGTFQKSES